MRSIRRVLLVHPYGIGDFLFVTPVLRALRLIPSVEKVDLLLGSRTDAVVRNNPHVDEIFVVDKDRIHSQSGWKSFKEMWRLGNELRAQNYDLMLDYSFRGEYAFLARFFLGVARSAGFDRKNRGFFHHIKYRLAKGFQDKHVVDYYCELAERAGVMVKDRWLECYLSANDRREAFEILNKESTQELNHYLVLSPGGGESWGKDADFKRWPARYFAKFADNLVQKFNLNGAVIVGSEKEKMLCEEVSSEVESIALNLAGKLTINQTAAIIERAGIFAGNDGGLVHIAHALRTPVIAFFGPVDPNVYGPTPKSEKAISVFKVDLECRPCYQNFRYKSDCVGRECLQDFKPEEVFRSLESKSFFDAIASHKDKTLSKSS